jgi:hypothetical protein
METEMKKRLSTLVMVSMLALFVLTACGAVSSLGDVSTNGKAFMAALRDGDHETSWNLLDPALQDEFGSYDSWVEFAAPRNFSESTFSATNVSGSEATMDGEAIIGSETYLVNLVFYQTGDAWLISGIQFSLK